MEIIKKVNKFFVWLAGQLFAQIIFSVLILPILTAWIASRPSVKSRLIEILKFKEFYLYISIASASAAMIAFCWAIYLYWKYQRYHRKFDVFWSWVIHLCWNHLMYRRKFGVCWDNNNEMRCPACKNYLKPASNDTHLFWCIDPKCNNKLPLRTDEGKPLTKAAAEALLIQKAKLFVDD